MSSEIRNWQSHVTDALYVKDHENTGNVMLNS